jgi:mono/diheme cytochrome c family protein
MVCGYRAKVAAWSGFFIITAFGLKLPGAAQEQSAASGGDKPVTFSKDIAPILQRTCQQCHRPDSLAPMSLIKYEEVRPYARAMKARTALNGKQGVMPPWHVEKGVGVQHYKDDISLTKEEIGKIAKWADSGAVQGNPADMPRLCRSRPPLLTGTAVFPETSRRRA